MLDHLKWAFRAQRQKNTHVDVRSVGILKDAPVVWCHAFQQSATARVSVSCLGRTMNSVSDISLGRHVEQSRELVRFALTVVWLRGWCRVSFSTPAPRPRGRLHSTAIVDLVVRLESPRVAPRWNTVREGEHDDRAEKYSLKSLIN